MQKSWGLSITVQAVHVKASNMTMICCEFLAVKKGKEKKINGVSVVNFVQNHTVVIKGGNLGVQDVETLHTFNYRINHTCLYYPVFIYNLQRWKHSPFILWLWSVPQVQSITLTCVRQIFCNGLVFETDIYFAFFVFCLKILLIFDATKTCLERVGRAANHQNNLNHRHTTDMEDNENRPLNKPITEIMNQHTWKCTPNTVTVTLSDRTEPRTEL